MRIKAPRPIKFGEIKEANMIRKSKKQVGPFYSSPVESIIDTMSCLSIFKGLDISSSRRPFDYDAFYDSSFPVTSLIFLNISDNNEV